MIVKARGDGKVYFADTEPGDVYQVNGEWWVVDTVGEWDPYEAGERARRGTSRPAKPLDLILERLNRIVELLER